MTDKTLELHELKLLLQRHFTDGLVTVVGSGLSCAEGLPGMGTLASHLEATVGTALSVADQARWAEIVPLIAVKGLEGALLEKAPTASIEAAIAASTADIISKHEREVIEEVFAGARILRFTRLLKHLLKPAAGVPVVTTNYDRLLEVAAEEAGFGVDTMFVGHYAGQLNEQESNIGFLREVTLKAKNVRYHYRQRVNIFKPHGSLDWYMRDGRPVRHFGDLHVPRLIITPGLNKFRNGYESPFDRHRERANGAIDRASRLLVLGYGFNDDHLETHLTPRIRAGAPTLMLTHELSPNALKIARENPAVVAIQHGTESERDGSFIMIGAKEFFVPELSLWDLHNFVSEVLEP